MDCSSLQYHMTLQKPSEIGLIDVLLLKKHFILLSMLKTVVLLNNFVKTRIKHVFSLMNRYQKRRTFYLNGNHLYHYKCLYSY